MLPLRCNETCNQDLEESKNLLSEEHVPFVKTQLFSLWSSAFLYFQKSCALEGRSPVLVSNLRLNVSS